MQVSHQEMSIAQRTFGVGEINNPHGIQEAYSNLMAVTFPAVEEFEQECSRLDTYDVATWQQIPLNEQERMLTLFILRQIFNEGHIRYSNSLQHWPAYEGMYNGLSHPQTARERRWALQIGSCSPLSSAAFSALASDVYNARPLTIDLTISPMRAQHGNHAVADGFHLGLAGDTIHVAQTNCLLHMLQTPDDIAAEDRLAVIFTEVHRVLQPGGFLLLYELASGLDNSEHPAYASERSKRCFADFKTKVVESLQLAGFASIIMNHAIQIEGVDYLFDRQRNFNRYPSRERPATIAVTAQKLT